MVFTMFSEHRLMCSLVDRQTWIQYVYSTVFNGGEGIKHAKTQTPKCKPKCKPSGPSSPLRNAHISVHMTAHNCGTQQHRTALIIFPLILQTIITACLMAVCLRLQTCLQLLNLSEDRSLNQQSSVINKSARTSRPALPLYRRRTFLFTISTLDAVCWNRRQALVILLFSQSFACSRCWSCDALVGLFILSFTSANFTSWQFHDNYNYKVWTTCRQQFLTTLSLHVPLRLYKGLPRFLEDSSVTTTS